MAKRDRDTLKRFFQKGALPSADHFSDLIDTSLNMHEDGFSKSPEDGFMVSTIANKKTLMSFYRHNTFDDPIWAFKFNTENFENLEIVQKVTKEKRAPVATFTPQGCVGINNDSPACALDINGKVKSQAREGMEDKAVYADYKFYDITEGLKGCHAIELVAGVGIKFSGMYALMHAIAINTFHPQRWFDKLFIFGTFGKSIKKQHAYYSSYSHRLKLRWCKKEDGKYYLQLGTHCDYCRKYKKSRQYDGEKIRVRYHLTFLWDDPSMVRCLEPVTQKNSGLMD